MKHTDNLLKSIKAGMLGLNVGLSTGLDKLDEIIAGVQRSTIYDLVGGLASGKTSFALYSFLYKPLMTELDNPNFHILIFSLEITAQTLLAKLLALRIYHVYGVEIKYSKLFSRNKNHLLTDDEFELVEKELPWLLKVEGKLIIHDKSLTPEVFSNVLLRIANEYGEFTQVGEETVYKPHHPDFFLLAFLDHVGLIRKRQRNVDKERCY